MQALTLLTMTVAVALAASEARAQTFSFDKETPGKAPSGFSCGLTGRGKPGVWIVKADDTAPSPPNALAQTDPDPTDYRFPVCTVDAISAADVDVSVRFKAISGSVDQAAGLVWRFTDVNNYYIVRANAKENNVTLYKVEGGKRTSPFLNLGDKASAKLLMEQVVKNYPGTDQARMARAKLAKIK